MRRCVGRATALPCFGSFLLPRLGCPRLAGRAFQRSAAWLWGMRQTALLAPRRASLGGPAAKKWVWRWWLEGEEDVEATRREGKWNPEWQIIEREVSTLTGL
jgi:hypothetical protein